MSEIVNLRRVRKAKARAEAGAQAGVNRAKHGTAKHERELAKARAEKLERAVDAHKLDKRSRP
ncbi:MAG TPA: DUF4169 family protein [Rhizomicrobium sp.]|jgi:hypothetical protein|nr:DUF4169 family protein [Rhizomicrobium sp.]